jgi:pilus assembly protein Flp/PilA
MKLVRRLLTQEKGQDLVEYALLIAVIALALVAAVQSFATGLNSVFTSISTALGTL